VISSSPEIPVGALGSAARCASPRGAFVRDGNASGLPNVAVT
jgi:hypothetical protein